MLKITALLSLMFIVSSVFAACNSCGSECASACGTRRFRACCFNYLRKKRGPEGGVKILDHDVQNSQQKSELPVFVIQSIPVPEQWMSYELSSENHPNSLEDMFENHLY